MVNTMSAMKKINDRILVGAANYARADKSDPFAYSRAICHAKNGVSSVNNAQQKPGYYDAEETVEHREYVHEGRTVKYTVPAFINIIRP